MLKKKKIHNFKRRVKFNLNIFLATLFYEWRKDISQQIWDSRKYQMTSYFVPTVIIAATL